MSTLDTIMERRSIRTFQDKPIESDKLERILQAARQAPSACNKQDWLFYCVTNPELLKRVAASMKQGFGATGAALVVACGPAEDRIMDCGQPAGTVDVSIATTFLQLVAWEEGIGSCWIGAFDAQAAAEALDVPEGMVPMTLTVLGYPAESPAMRPRKDPAEVVRFLA